MLCNDVQDLLAAYLDGGIDDPDTQAEIAQHLAGCADCRAERDSLAMVLAHVSPVIKAAGDAVRISDAITVPDVGRIADAGRTPSRSIQRPIARWPFSSNHKQLRDEPIMQNNPKIPTPRRTSVLNGAMTFALSLVLLVFVWLIFNGVMQRSPAGGGTDVLPTEAAEQPKPLIQFADPNANNTAAVNLRGYEVRLNGAVYSLDANPYLVPGDRLTVVFDLQSIQGAVGGIGTFVQLVDANGQVIAQNDAVISTDPFEGQTENTLTIPPDMPAGTYQLFAGLSLLEDGIHLPILLDGQPAPGDALPLQDMIEVADAPTSPTPTPPAPPTMVNDPLLTTGGFRENPVDVTTLPEYTLSNGGGGGGGGGGGDCPEVEPRVGVAVAAEFAELRYVCIYGVPDVTEGATFRITLVSPSGQSYEANYTVLVDGMGMLGADRDMNLSASVSITPINERNTIGVPLWFPAHQEYGEWFVKGSTQVWGDFAIGTINIVASQPMFSVALNDTLPDPFEQYYQPHFKSGDRVIFAGRGLEAGRSLVLALYREDETRRTDSTNVMIPAYAAQVTLSEDGSYQVEFVVGEDTPLAYFSGVFDPEPAEYLPQPFGMMVQ